MSRGISPGDEVSGDDFGPQLERANELIALGRDGQAMDLLLQLLRSYPHQAGVLEVCLSRAHLVAGRYEEARQHALRAVAAQPDHYAGHLLYGIALQLMRRPQEAIEPLRTATRLEHSDPDPPQWLAQVLTDAGHSGEAYQAAGEALRRDPNAPGAHFAMGYVLQESNPAEAKRAYLKTLELNPEHHGAKHNLAGIAVQAGDWQTGSRGMAAVLADNPQAQSPVFVLDQRVVGTIRWLHWLLFGGWIGYRLGGGVAAGTGSEPVFLTVVTVLLLVGAVLLVRAGIKPIRAAMPSSTRQFLAGFPRREPIATVWAGFLGLGWLCFLGTAIAVWVAPDTEWILIGVLGCLIVGLILSWVRVPIANARAQRVRRQL